MRSLRVAALALLGCLTLVAASSQSHSDPAPMPLPLPVHGSHSGAENPVRVLLPAAPIALVRSHRVVRRANVPAPRHTSAARPVHRAVWVQPVARPDGYPFRADQSQAPDPWGFTMRQCVSYAAWRLASSGHPLSNARNRWGSALQWDDTARSLGFAVNNSPTVGSVAQWNPGEASPLLPGGRFTAGPYGHVAYVTAVYGDGSVQVAQYNAVGDRGFSSMRLIAPRYLHL